MSNGLSVQSQSVAVALRTSKYQKFVDQALNDPQRSKQLVSSIISAALNNPDLNNCTVESVISAALLGEALKLSPSPQLGHFYMVPFNDNKNNRKVATFILGYKGYIQLAIRSGFYKKIHVLAIKKGELVRYDPLDEEIEVNLIQDELDREVAETTGYYAMFEYQNGFRKTMYWSKAKMEQHAIRYSPGYRAKKGYTFWEKDFDGMAFKTMLRQLISKWGIMSIEMQTAFDGDNAVISEDLTPNFINTEDIGSIPEAPSGNLPPSDSVVEPEGAAAGDGETDGDEKVYSIGDIVDD